METTIITASLKTVTIAVTSTAADKEIIIIIGA
jgi:hypothetical protein